MREYPLYYFHNSKQSDRDWIISKMRFIPAEKRDEVSKEYERIYLSGHFLKTRKQANEYLQKVARSYYEKLKHG